ncbi:ANTAR domain-containing protein [Arthrobacter sp. TMN-37]
MRAEPLRGRAPGLRPGRHPHGRGLRQGGLPRAPLRLAVRIARLSDTDENLRAAMQARTTIDLAVGIIMAQNRCSQDSAMTILKAASSARNVKLREVAAAVVASAGHSARQG